MIGKRALIGERALYGGRRRIFHAALLFLAAVSTPAMAADRLILALGDSLTAGYGLAPAQAFPVRLEAALRKAGVAARGA